MNFHACMINSAFLQERLSIQCADVVLSDYAVQHSYLSTQKRTVFCLFFRPLQFNYLSYELRRQELSHFGIKKKVEKCGFFYFFYFFRVCRLGLVARCFYQPVLNKIKSIDPCYLKGGRYASSSLRLYYVQH